MGAAIPPIQKRARKERKLGRKHALQRLDLLADLVRGGAFRPKVWLIRVTMRGAVLGVCLPEGRTFESGRSLLTRLLLSTSTGEGESQE